MKPARSLIVSTLFFVVAAGVAAWLYPQLPARVPSHWDIHGRVNDTLPRFWGAAFPALAILGLALLTAVLPRISPRRFEIAPFARAWDIVMLATQGMVLVTGLCALLVGAGYALPMPVIALLSVGVLFMVIGNYMGKLRRNFLIGVRTPWTLTSAAVWERTHRLAGWLFMLAGVVAVVAALVGPSPWIALLALAGAALYPCVYSYLVYRKLERGA